MPPKKSKPTDAWADLLQAELAETSERPPGSMTFEEIVISRKAAGLPHGWCYVYAWLRKMIESGKMTKLETTIKGLHKRKVNRVFYTAL